MNPLEAMRSVRAAYIREFNAAFDATQDMSTSDADFRKAKTRIDKAEEAIEACDRCINAYLDALCRKDAA